MKRDGMLVDAETAQIIPKIGDKIYVDTCLHIERGEDDISGGMAEITSVETSDFLPQNHINYYMVSFKGLPMRHNYRLLLQKQAELKAEFGEAQAKHSPDYNDYEDRSEWKQL